MLSALCVTHAFATRMSGRNMVNAALTHSLEPANKSPAREIYDDMINAKFLEPFQSDFERLIQQVLNDLFAKCPFIHNRERPLLDTGEHLISLMSNHSERQHCVQKQEDLMKKIDSEQKRFALAAAFIRNALVRQRMAEHIDFSQAIRVTQTHMTRELLAVYQRIYNVNVSLEELAPATIHMPKLNSTLREYFNMMNNEMNAIQKCRNDAEMHKIMSETYGADCKELFGPMIHPESTDSYRSRIKQEISQRQKEMERIHDMLQAVFSSSPESTPDPAAADQAHSTGSSASGASIPDPTPETASTQPGPSESAASEPKSSASELASNAEVA